MKPTKQDAEAMLKDAGEIGTAVRARAPQEYPLYVGRGLTVLLIGLACDLNDAGGLASVVGATLVLVALAVTVGTNGTYLRRYRQVRRRSTPRWLEWALGLWSAAALFSLGISLDGTIATSFTLGGIVGAVPFLVWALRLRRTA
jgi:membrane associated rhomboid family serine protease